LRRNAAAGQHGKQQTSLHGIPRHRADSPMIAPPPCPCRTAAGRQG
jgi:hypothetical protein